MWCFELGLREREREREKERERERGKGGVGGRGPSWYLLLKFYLAK